ncbi:DUF6440 family protein [Viridibacillus sp. FSL R5-0477]|uniref:DUF6440 domain-containing protein n=1 Tax=Viridibacillus arenosi FSL R5-213 TaxID=1227360 RepID=W4EKF5_9BACL|nr:MULTISPECIES: DUF6440 family protein [Viridibacillus]ETT81040.1 hypothetical protein C176_20044 [Viridibacillus arenosi FSL R5-213]OMC83994.1 hypothetical protein BK130_05680 [Viridibacillus sp. FSL H8-0123]OMC88516.1 hypothetical protein BK128_00800 [Viridibacillus sp. FSL H7-0596]OMC93151.1 hypothetical protein BK137_01105 [Viridibacillus arenosi]
MFSKDSEKNKGSKKRFEEILSENGVANGNRIIVDRETGIHYLFSWSGYAGGITPLLDSNGKPVIKPNNE